MGEVSGRKRAGFQEMSCEGGCETEVRTRRAVTEVRVREAGTEVRVREAGTEVRVRGPGRK